MTESKQEPDKKQKVSCHSHVSETQGQNLAGDPPALAPSFAVALGGKTVVDLQR